MTPNAAAVGPQPGEIAAEWTQHHPTGTPVIYWPGAPYGPGRYGTTRTPAWVLSGKPVVTVDGYPGCIALTHVRTRDNATTDPVRQQVEDLSPAEEHVALAWLAEYHPDAVASALRHIRVQRAADDRALHTPAKETTR